MVEIFNIITMILEGLLDISNKAIGILIAWTLFGVPLLFLLAIFDFLRTLLEQLNIKPIDEEDTPPISPP